MNHVLFTYIYIILELINYLLTYIVIFRAKIKKRKTWLFGLLPIFLIIYVLIQSKGNEFARHMIEILGILIPLFALQGNKWKWAFLYPATVMLPSILSICISFILAISAGVSELDTIYMANSVIVCEAGSGLILILIGMYEKWKKKESFEMEFMIRQYLILYGGIICAVILIGCAQALSNAEVLLVQERNWYGLAVTVICLLFMFMGLWNSIIVYNQERYQHQIEMLNEHMVMQEKQIKTVIQNDEKLRSYRHDMKAHLLALQSLCENNSSNFRQYVNEIIGASDIFHTVSFTGNAAVDAVLSNLNESAAINNIPISYECALPEQLPLTLFDLCTVLSNLIQNAVEACEQNKKEKEISVTIYPFGDRLYIKVKNPVEHPVEMEGRKLITSKRDKENHGIGSENVRRAVEKCGGEINYTCLFGWFTVEILI